ncbi:MAG: hypothetical protein H0V17_13765 [Deltaproteobacteria bacterium]|nr:hypothetical protein [Deltaproteobacteria bacterium]
MSRSGKLLGVAAVLFLALLIFMWRSMDESATATPVIKRDPEAAARRASISIDTPIKQVEPVVAAAPAEPGKVEKLDPMSDEFFFRFTEKVPKELTYQAATCYEGLQGSLHRNQKVVLVFDVIVKDGVVGVHNVKVKPADPDDPKQKNNTLSNPALESCFIQKVARAGWKDEALPDYTWPDELVLRPERGMKGYMKSDRDYVGAEAPKRDPKAHLAIKPAPQPAQPDQPE